jgi:ABC-2 type transport system ATP-binding protein
MDAIRIQQVKKTYGNGARPALDGLDLTVRRGEVFGFLGMNGAGKTTTIKMILGFFPPTSGAVEVLGGDPREPETRRRIGYMPEVADYYGYLTVGELLHFYGRICGMSVADIRRRGGELLELVGLQDAGRKQLKHFSKGMMQRAGIAQALLHDPELLILDEPLTGLDPLARIQLRDIIVMLRKQGKTVFFSSHELSEAEMICDRVGILKDGKLCCCGGIAEVAGDGAGNLERIFLQHIREGR